MERLPQIRLPGDLATTQSLVLADSPAVSTPLLHLPLGQKQHLVAVTKSLTEAT